LQAIGGALGIGAEQINPLLAIAAPIVGGLLGGAPGAAIGGALVNTTGFAGGN